MAKVCPGAAKKIHPHIAHPTENPRHFTGHRFAAHDLEHATHFVERDRAPETTGLLARAKINGNYMAALPGSFGLGLVGQFGPFQVARIVPFTQQCLVQINTVISYG